MKADSLVKIAFKNEKAHISVSAQNKSDQIDRVASLD